VNLLPPAFQQALIGGVLYERMLESVSRVGRNSTPKNEFGLFELVQGTFELSTIGTGHSSQKPMVEDAADASTGLSHLLDQVETVEACH
jgi:hypothetical protein